MARVSYLYDVPLPNSYSATIQILRTAHAMAELGDEVTVWTAPHAADLQEFLAALAMPPHPRLRLTVAFPAWPRAPWLRRWRNRVRLDGRTDWSDADVVVSRGETGFALASALVRRRTPPKFVYEIHRLIATGHAEARLGRSIRPQDTVPRALHRAEARVMGAADGFICLTEAVRDAARRQFGLDRPTLVAPSGVEVPTEPMSAPKDVDVVILGKIERRKGVDLAIRAMAHLEGRTLRCIGDGPWLEPARRLAGDLGIADRIEFVGRIPHAQVPAALARARIGLCPLPAGFDRVSEKFSSPLKLLEMMAVGLPIVATDVPAVRAICRNRIEALLVPPDSPSLVAAGLAELLGNTTLAASLSGAARRRALDFTWQRRAEAISAFLQSI